MRVPVPTGQRASGAPLWPAPSPARACQHLRPAPAATRRVRGGRFHATLSSVAGRAAADLDQLIREGDCEKDLVARQASKEDNQQPSILDYLKPYDPDTDPTPAVIIIGCGPAGLALSGALAKNGVKVVLVGLDSPFVNNYGVWVDEFKSLGLEHVIDKRWEDTVCFMGEGQEFKVGRAYGRVSRRLLRDHLLTECAAVGVTYYKGEVEAVDCATSPSTCVVTCSGGVHLRSRLVTVAAGAASSKFLQHEDNVPTVASQTAYGIEVDLEGYETAYDPSLMLFMDFRRYHTGFWEGTTGKAPPGAHPNGSPLWGSEHEVPSFLYAMPLGGNRVFLEETCLVSKPPLPFNTLKRRLERRLENMGLRVTQLHEEEWSYIPVGGPLPVGSQSITAFGASANLVHPATGYSIARSLSEAPKLAQEMAAALQDNTATVAQLAERVWGSLWPLEKRRQAAFHLFGMELLAQMNLESTGQFFGTFFELPDLYWRGFLASNLSSPQLIIFALLTFVKAPMDIRWKLMTHLFGDPSGAHMVDVFTKEIREGIAAALQDDQEKKAA